MSACLTEPANSQSTRARFTRVRAVAVRTAIERSVLTKLREEGPLTSRKPSVGIGVQILTANAPPHAVLVRRLVCGFDAGQWPHRKYEPGAVLKASSGD